jgi:hypothetical protein
MRFSHGSRPSPRADQPGQEPGQEPGQDGGVIAGGVLPLEQVAEPVEGCVVGQGVPARLGAEEGQGIPGYELAAARGG